MFIGLKVFDYELVLLVEQAVAALRAI